jgi:hypothetical protein
MELNDFVVYPNPVKSKTVFVKNVSASDEFYLFDQLGKSIPIINKQLNTSTNEITLSFPQSISQGLYFLKINNTSKLLFIAD